MLLGRARFIFLLAMAVASILLFISLQEPARHPELPVSRGSTIIYRQLPRRYHSMIEERLENPETVTVDDPFYPILPPENSTAQDRIAWMRDNVGRFKIFKSDERTRKFNSRVIKFFNNSGCSVRFFMTWIAPVSDFGERHSIGVDSMFKSNPDACLIIVSQTMDSYGGKDLLEPFTSRGLKVTAISPDLPFLFSKTPVQDWFDRLRNGNIDPGEIPLAQNLSNLMRLALLYKYGGVYLDMDFVVLKDFRGLRNSIGAQSVDPVSGNWTRLNNAAMVFDRHHPVLKKFMAEFANTFNGSRWGYNGPYLVSRVVERVQRERRSSNLGLTVLPPMAFYPVMWTRIGGLFEEPRTRPGQKWVEAKVAQLKQRSYGVHLWNKQSKGISIEDGSVMDRLTSEQCVICSRRKRHPQMEWK